MYCLYNYFKKLKININNIKINNFFKFVFQHKILISSINNYDNINKYFLINTIFNKYSFVVLLIFITKFLKI